MRMIVAVLVEAVVQMGAGVFEDAAGAGVAFWIGGNGEGVQPGEAAFYEGEHVGGIGRAEELGATGHDVHR